MSQISNLTFAAHPASHHFVDLSGQRFGRLKILGYKGRERRHSWWLCECDCGNEHVASTNELTRSDLKRRLKSCGCTKYIRKHGSAGRGKETAEYRIFEAAKSRCTNPNHPAYRNYGGRGIKFLFTSFEQFIEHIGLRPGKEFSLDRINNDGNYEIGNVRWATRSQQGANKRPWNANC
jgi:hypothetical protein